LGFLVLVDGEDRRHLFRCEADVAAESAVGPTVFPALIAHPLRAEPETVSEALDISEGD
jgi:hypothetical protein